MLLDLNRGTLAVYKNGRRLGVMSDRLRGVYVWAAVVRQPIQHYEDFVRIDRRTAPGLDTQDHT